MYLKVSILWLWDRKERIEWIPLIEMAELKRSLGFWTVLALAVSSIMGTGLFLGIGIGAGYSGNASILAWVILSLIAIYISMYFGELASMYPKAGGIYEFSKHAYSRFLSFLMGWTAWVVGNLATALLIVAAVDYIIPNPSQLWLKRGVSVLLIVALNLIAYIGVEIGAFLLVAFAVVSVSVFLSFIFPGLFYISIANYSPFFVSGASSIFVTMFFIAETFFGWESATYLAEETHDPEKSIPKAIIIGTLIVGILGILMAVVSLGVVNWKILADLPIPLSIVSEKVLGSFGMEIVNIGIIVTLIGSAASGVITLPRLLLAMARDKLFIAQLSSIHEKFKTPYKAIIFQTIISLLMFGMVFGKYRVLLKLLLPLGFIMYFFVVLSVPILRSKEPSIRREFKVPFAKTGAVILTAFIAGVIILWMLSDAASLETLKLGFSLIFMGVPVYLLLKVYYDPDAAIKLNDLLAYITLWSESVIFPKRVREDIFSLLGDIKNKKILEFGCSVGTLTMALAEGVKPNGRVYAIDMSKNELSIASRRLVRRGHSNVFVIHDEHQINRVHPKIPHVDAIASIGMMGYIQDVKKVLKEMRDLLPYGGKIVFMEYADFFKVIPNVAWLSSNKEIEKVFREAGFSVFVTRKRGLFWNYIYVYGIKFHEDIPYV